LKSSIGMNRHIEAECQVNIGAPFVLIGD
jgi:hypothetical protein